MTAALTVYTNIKVRLPLLADRLYDEAFLAADRWMFGQHMHEYLVEWVASSLVVTGVLDILYVNNHLFFVFLVFILWAYEKARLLRILLFSYSISYILGIIISVQFPSYGLFYFVPENYAFLDHLTSGSYQAGLLQDFEQNRRFFESTGLVRTEPYNGITAFPSLHVAHMVIVTLVGWKFSRRLGIFCVCFSLVGTLSTIALGWHYVMDGLAGCALGVFTTESTYWWVTQKHERKDT
jgi:membrane-associated phospholipid phosphatase